MKRLIVVLAIVLMAGIAYAQSTGPTPAPTPPTSIAADQPNQQPAETPPPPEKETVKAKMHFGPAVGVFLPTSGKVQDTFGSSWTRFGLRPFLTEVPDRWRFMFDLSYYAMDNGTDSATLIPITAGFMRGISQHKDMLTYVALNAGPFYGDVDSPTVGVSKTGWALNGNATVGMLFNQRWLLEARYDFMPSFAGFDFSAFSVSVGYRMFDMTF